jgi:hypothetical protein
MAGVLVVVQPTSEGWVVTVTESGVVVYQAVGYLSPHQAQDAGQVWVALHRSGVACLIEIRSVPDSQLGQGVVV